MQLNDIVKDHGLKAISQATKISDENIKLLQNEDFSKMRQVQALGFISILEREYKINLELLKDRAGAYYSENSDSSNFSVGISTSAENKSDSKGFLFIIFIIFVFASWYFITNFDNKYLREYIPFLDDKSVETIILEDETAKISNHEDNNTKVKKEKVVEKRIEKKIEKKVDEKVNDIDKSLVLPLEIKKEELSDTKEEVAEKTVELNETVNIDSEITNEINDSTEEKVGVVKDITPKDGLFIVPVGKLWFGLIDMETKKRKNFTVNEAYELALEGKKWLLATSSAPFFIINSEEAKEFNDAREHYFIVDGNGATLLTKKEYIAKGGWRKW